LLLEEPEQRGKEGFRLLRREYGLPVICSVHPRTRSKLRQGDMADDGLRGIEPPGLFDFVKLEKNARCVLSDSGTVQEECCVFRTPSVTIRDVTERPETIEAGSNMLSGADPDALLRCVKTVLAAPPAWAPPPEYLVENVATTVAKIVLGFRLKGW